MFLLPFSEYARDYKIIYIYAQDFLTELACDFTPSQNVSHFLKFTNTSSCYVVLSDITGTPRIIQQLEH